MRKACTAILVAAGSARRMQGIDKAVAPIGGVPMLRRTAEALGRSDRIDAIHIVTRADLVETVEALCAGLPKVQKILPGGDARSASVLAGLAAVETPLVAVHDGARPLVTVPVIDGAVEMAERYGAAAPAVGVHDTVKIARAGVVLSTPDRASLFAVQTPQVFDTDLLRRALTEGIAKGLPLTDDCSAVEAAGYAVRLTPGSVENLKITTPIDLRFAEAILKERDNQ